MYWFTMMVRGWKSNKDAFQWRVFFLDNALEMPFTLVASFVVIYLGYSKSPDEKGWREYNFGLGVVGGVLVDNIITAIKPDSFTPKTQ